MARISTYGIDADPSLGDKIIGTDTSSGAIYKTKNYSIYEVVQLLNKTNNIGVADQVLYLFQSDISEGRDLGTISLEAGNGVGTPLGSITKVLLSKTLIGGKPVSNYLPLFSSKYIILAELGNINTFGAYKIISIIEHPVETNFFEVTLESWASNGGLALDATYIFSEFEQPGVGEDKTFVFNQSTAQPVWEVQHDLYKFPSVTMVLSTGQTGYGDVTYIDNNNLTITFASAESGKAYIN